MISGLGADKRFFKNIVLPQAFDKITVDVLVPLRSDTIPDYAKNLIDKYGISVGDVVMGDSLGGMIAVEIAKLIKLSKVILTSTIKTDSEAPLYFKILRKLPVYRMTPGKLVTRLAAVVKPVLDKVNAVDANVLRSMLQNSSPEFLKWGAQAALNWKNDIIPDNLYHIIGDKDLVFPYQNIKEPTAIIKGGTHIMVFDKANEINQLLAEILTK